MEEIFRTFGDICHKHNNDDLIVNVATGDRMSTCAALSAAFTNGLKAIGVGNNNQCMLMPIMKLSYYNELSETKLIILKQLSTETFISIKTLACRLGMSISLVSYHINGNPKYKGLKDYRLVETKQYNRTLLVRLSEMGGLLLKDISS